VEGGLITEQRRWNMRLLQANVEGPLARPLNVLTWCVAWPALVGIDREAPLFTVVYHGSGHATGTPGAQPTGWNDLAFPSSRCLGLPPGMASCHTWAVPNVGNGV